jgi:hypothetical protein
MRAWSPGTRGCDASTYRNVPKVAAMSVKKNIEIYGVTGSDDFNGFTVLGFLISTALGYKHLH